MVVREEILPVKVDAKDRKIIDALYQNSRLQIKDIAKKTHIPRDSVNYRIKRMLKEGVIRFFTAILEPARLGHPIYTHVCIMIKSFDKDEIRKFESYLKSHPKVIYCCRTSGKYHYIISVAAKNLSHFDTILSEILDRFQNLIKDYDASSILEEFKFDTFSGLIEQEKQR